jgi:hypothetical protein
MTAAYLKLYRLNGFALLQFSSRMAVFNRPIQGDIGRAERYRNLAVDPGTGPGPGGRIRLTFGGGIGRTSRGGGTRRAPFPSVKEGARDSVGVHISAPPAPCAVDVFALEAGRAHLGDDPGELASEEAAGSRVAVVPRRADDSDGSSTCAELLMLNLATCSRGGGQIDLVGGGPKGISVKPPRFSRSPITAGMMAEDHPFGLPLPAPSSFYTGVAARRTISGSTDARPVNPTRHTRASATLGCLTDRGQ